MIHLPKAGYLLKFPNSHLEFEDHFEWIFFNQELESQEEFQYFVYFPRDFHLRGYHPAVLDFDFLT